MTAYRYLDGAFGGRAARRAADCTYYSTQWNCWFLHRGGYWVGVRFEVTRYRHPLAPLWKVTNVVPDM